MQASIHVLFPGTNLEDFDGEDVRNRALQLIHEKIEEGNALRDITDSEEFLAAAFRYYHLEYSNTSEDQLDSSSNNRTDEDDNEDERQGGPSSNGSSRKFLILDTETNPWADELSPEFQESMCLALYSKKRQFGQLKEVKPGDSDVGDFDMCVSYMKYWWRSAQQVIGNLLARHDEHSILNIHISDLTNHLFYMQSVSERLLAFLTERAHQREDGVLLSNFYGNKTDILKSSSGQLLNKSMRQVLYLIKMLKCKGLLLLDDDVWEEKVVHRSTHVAMNTPVFHLDMISPGDVIVAELLQVDEGCPSVDLREITMTYIGEGAFSREQDEDEDEDAHGAIYVYFESHGKGGGWTQEPFERCQVKSIEQQLEITHPADMHQIEDGDDVVVITRAPRRTRSARGIKLDDWHIEIQGVIYELDEEDDDAISLRSHQRFQLYNRSPKCAHCGLSPGYHVHRMDRNPDKTHVFKPLYHHFEDELVGTRYYKKKLSIEQWVSEACSSSDLVMYSAWLEGPRKGDNFVGLLKKAACKDIPRVNPRRELKAFRNGILDMKQNRFFSLQCVCGERECICESTRCIKDTKHDTMKQMCPSHCSSFYDQIFPEHILKRRNHAGKPNPEHLYNCARISEHIVCPTIPPFENFELNLDIRTSAIKCTREGCDCSVPLPKVNYSATPNSKKIVFYGLDEAPHALVLEGQMVLLRADGQRGCGCIMERHVTSYSLFAEDASAFILPSEWRIPKTEVCDCFFPWKLKPTSVTKEIKVPFFDRLFMEQFTSSSANSSYRRGIGTGGREEESELSVRETEQLLMVVKFLIGYAMMIDKETHALDVFLYIYGAAGSGKTLIGNIIRYLFPEEKIAELASGAQKDFAFEDVLPAWLCIGGEVVEKFFQNFTQDRVQELASLSRMKTNVKYDKGKTGYPSSLFVALSNYPPGWKDGNASISRRCVCIRLPKYVPKDKADKTYIDKLKQQVPELMVACSSAYRDVVKEHPTANIWKIIEILCGGNSNNYFEQQKKEINSNVNPLVAMLDRVGSRTVAVAPGNYVRFDVFKETLSKFCKKERLETFFSASAFSYRTNEAIFKRYGIRRAVEKNVWPPCPTERQFGPVETPQFDTEDEIYLKGVGLIEHFASNQTDDDRLTHFFSALKSAFPQKPPKRKIDALYASW